MVNGILTAIIIFGTNQVSVQRALSLSSRSMILRFVNNTDVN